MNTIKVPTGQILIVNGHLGKLECLSIGDYGKQNNIKANFLGLHRQINGVLSTEIMPLSEKWVITISSQYGCSMNCLFCDVPNVGPGLNADVYDMNLQVEYALHSHKCKETKRLNIHYARMGEPTFNDNVIEHAKQLKSFVDYCGIKAQTVHPVISTMMPKNNSHLGDFLLEWCRIKNEIYHGEAGLQLSINTTNDIHRDKLFGFRSLSLHEISNIANKLPIPIGRKYCLNFPISKDSLVEGKVLTNLFDPEKFMVKITPIHITSATENNNIFAGNAYSSYEIYKDIEQDLLNNNFDVIVFVPSLDEDQSMITCGNAILSIKNIESDIMLYKHNKLWAAETINDNKIIIEYGNTGKDAIYNLSQRITNDKNKN